MGADPHHYAIPTVTPIVMTFPPRTPTEHADHQAELEHDEFLHALEQAALGEDRARDLTCPPACEPGPVTHPAPSPPSGLGVPSSRVGLTRARRTYSGDEGRAQSNLRQLPSANVVVLRPRNESRPGFGPEAA